MNDAAAGGPPGRSAGGAGDGDGDGVGLVVVMGVSGAGKTTVGERLAERLGLPFADADDFHPPENIAKMSRGEPLDDADRAPWLAAMAEWLSAHDAHHGHGSPARDGATARDGGTGGDGGRGGVLVSSALKHRYRDRLRKGAPRLFFLHLTGSEELIAERLRGRSGHFMPPSLLRSQFEALEPLREDEQGAEVSVDGSPGQTLTRALAALGSAEDGRLSG